jgi:4-amino-4-deoxy-L-arabinose transferase-like glycosyltransferase
LLLALLLLKLLLTLLLLHLLLLLLIALALLLLTLLIEALLLVLLNLALLVELFLLALLLVLLLLLLTLLLPLVVLHLLLLLSLLLALHLKAALLLALLLIVLLLLIMLLLLLLVIIVGQHLSTDAQGQETDTCQTPDAHVHAFLTAARIPVDRTAFWVRRSPHSISVLHETVGVRVVATRRVCDRAIVTNRRHKKRGLMGPLLNTSSWLDAFDAGSPRIVFWTVRSPVAWSTLLGLRPRLA